MNYTEFLWGIFYLVIGFYLCYFNYKTPDKQLKGKTIGSFFIGVIGFFSGIYLIIKFIYNLIIK
jgi:hypothetical protein